MVSGYPTCTSIPWVDGLSTDPRVLGRHNNHDEEIQSAKESFRVNYFLVVVDIEIASLKDRFNQLKIFENIFGFLFDSKKLKSLGDMN